MNESSSPKTCPRCGAVLPDSEDDLCPRCVMAEVMQPTQARDAAALLAPLTVQELAPLFPQLEIMECLGRGGMGVVYKARQKSLNRLVALKLLAPERVGDPEFAARFEREAHALAALNHPNIVAVHDFGQAGGFYFLLMEFVDGVNLRQLLQSKRLTPKEALSIVPPVCDALQCAHDHGIVHSDIKPENLLIDKEGVVKIADFGIARMLGEPHSPIIGTPQYMAPEQKEQRATDHRADIYSLGVVLYEMLTGEPPKDKLEAPSRRVQVDIRIDEIVLRATEKEPELRFHTAAEFRTRVEAVGSEPPSARTPGVSPNPWPRRIFWLIALALGTLLSGFAAMLLLYWASHDSGKDAPVAAPVSSSRQAEAQPVLNPVETVHAYLKAIAESRMDDAMALHDKEEREKMKQNRETWAGGWAREREGLDLTKIPIREAWVAKEKALVTTPALTTEKNRHGFQFVFKLSLEEGRWLISQVYSNSWREEDRAKTVLNFRAAYPEAKALVSTMESLKTESHPDLPAGAVPAAFEIHPIPPIDGKIIKGADGTLTITMDKPGVAILGTAHADALPEDYLTVFAANAKVVRMQEPREVSLVIYADRDNWESAHPAYGGTVLLPSCTNWTAIKTHYLANAGQKFSGFTLGIYFQSAGEVQLRLPSVFTMTGSQFTKWITAPRPPAKPADAGVPHKIEKLQNDVPFTDPPKLQYIAWLPKSADGWRLRTPAGEVVKAPGAIPQEAWDGWMKGILPKPAPQKEAGEEDATLVFFYSHPAIDERSESRVRLYSASGQEIEVKRWTSSIYAPRQAGEDGWFAIGCRVPGTLAGNLVKARIELSAGPWHIGPAVPPGETNNQSSGPVLLANSGEDPSRHAFVTVLTDDEMKLPQWEVLGHLREGDIVGCDHSTAVQFQHTIRFFQPLSAFTGFFIRSREKKTFPFKDIHVPPMEKDP